MKDDSYIIVLVTCPGHDEAIKVATALLEAKLAACVNIAEDIHSYYWWQGKIDNSKETLLIIKSKKNLFEKLCQIVKTCHSYDTPEIIAIPICRGDSKYLKWIDDSVGL